MHVRRWLAVCCCAVLLLVAVWAAWNLLLDPFGVFGDRLINRYDFNITQNPRTAKITYLEEHFDQYDSYVLGDAKAASLPVDALDERTGAHFYNLTWDDSSLQESLQTLQYLIGHDEVKNIVLTLDPQDAVRADTRSVPVTRRMHCRVDGSSSAAFYARYVFAAPTFGLRKLITACAQGYLPEPDAAYDVQTGCRNNAVRDVTRVGARYEFQPPDYGTEPVQMDGLDAALDALQEIKTLCSKKHIRLTVIGIPVYAGEFQRYPAEQMQAFWTGAAAITPFYDFWGYHTVSGDIRYFYDASAFRSDVGRMMLSYIYGDEERYLPADFGHMTTEKNVAQRIAETYGPDAVTVTDPDSYTADVPVLMYHSFTTDEAEKGWAILHVEDFRSQLEALRDAGFESITFDQLIDFVDHGTPLPEKPILITMDDGYTDNLELAAPLLEEYGFNATVAVIGSLAGLDTSPDTGRPMDPRFALAEAKPWVDKGVLTITTHSFNMHQPQETDGVPNRPGVLMLPHESEQDYIRALKEDFRAACEQLQSELGLPCNVFVYPYGFCDVLPEAVLRSQGVRVSLTTNIGANEIVMGLPQTLIQLNRTDVHNGMDGDRLMRELWKELDVLS